MWEKIKQWFKDNNCRHHWHEIEGSRRKVKADRPRCNKKSDDLNLYIYDSITYSDDVVMYKVVEYCCFCGIKTMRWRNAHGHHNIKEAMRYPDIDDQPLDKYLKK